MEGSSIYTYRFERRSWTDRLFAFLEVLVLAGILSSSVAALPFYFQAGNRAIHAILLKDARLIAGFLLLEASITLFLLMLILRLHRERLADLGWNWDRWISDLLLGVSLVPILFLVGRLVALGFKVLLPNYYMERNPLIETIRSPGDLALFIVAALFAGGIKEELQRAFVLVRFRDYLGGAKLGLVIWSLAFGAAHYVQGVQGAAVAGLFGLLFGAVYLARGSVVAPMVAHGAYDSIALLAYWFLRGVSG
jgi:membrane protease YdiL (CAAX protease family)